MWSNAGAGESSSSQRKRRRRPAPAASPIEASPKGGSLPSTAESSGAASPLRRPCRNCKTGSHTVGPARDVNTTARPNGYTYPTSLSAMSPPLASAVGRLRIPPMSTRIGELPRRRRRSEPCGRAVCRWPLSSLIANCQMISVSDHSALLRLAAICSRIHASTSDSIQPTARAPSRIGWGKLPSATRT